MGTNYYLVAKPPCPTCGRAHEREHIGKSSCGWCFSLHVDPERGIRDLDDWIDKWEQPDAVIEDEYGKVVTRNEMLLVILARFGMRKKGGDDLAASARRNGAEVGPFGLLRGRIDGRHTIGHGSGTYDLCVGEFS